MSPKSNIEFLIKTGAWRQHSTAGRKCIQVGAAQGQGEASQVAECIGIGQALSGCFSIN